MSSLVDKQGHSQTYITLQEYANNLKNIVNSPGYLTSNYKMVCKQIDTINDMVENVKQVALTSIKRDLIDIMNKSIDWAQYKQNLTDFLKSVKHSKKAPMLNRPKFYSFKFQYNDTLEPLSNELIQNMFLTASDINEEANGLQYSQGYCSNRPLDEATKATTKEKTNKLIATYEDNKDTFIDELNEFVNSVSTWEANIVECRTNNIPVLMSNVNSLYEVHKKYAYEQFKGLPSSFEQDIDGHIIDCIKVKGKVIPLDKSQPRFIKNGIKILLDI